MGSTFTLYADFNLIDGGSTLTKNVTISTNTQVIGDGGVIFDNATVALVDGVLQVELPDNTNDPFDFGYTVRRATGLTKTWRVPVQEPGVRVLLTTFTSTTALPLPPSGNAVSQTDFIAYQAEAAAALADAIEALVDGAPGALDTLHEIATQLATDESAASAILATLSGHIADHANPHATTKAQVGLSNVDNTSDANKPVSTAQATAITTAINNLVNGAPGALDTLNEIAIQLGSDESAATALLNAVAALRGLTDSTFATNLSASYAAQLTTVAKSIDYTVGAQEFVEMDATAAVRTATGPAAGAALRWGVKKVNGTSAIPGNKVTIAYLSSAGAATTLDLTLAGESKVLRPSGSGYRVESGDTPRAGLDTLYATANTGARPTAIPSPAYIAHRGSADIAPEETMEAFRTSAALGAHGLEMDVQPLADGALGLMHDDTVDRTTDGTGNVSGFTAPAFRALNAASKYPPWNGKSVPPALLNEALAEFGGKTPLFIEPKDTSNATQVMDLVDAYGLRSYVVLETSSLTTLAAMKARGFTVYFYQGGTLANITAFASAITAGADYLGFDGTITANDTLVASMVALGKPVWPFTVNRRYRKTALLALGVTGFLTNQPAYLPATTAQRTVDSWRQGVLGHGFNVSALTQPNPTITAGVLAIPGASNQYAVIGEVSPIAAAAGSYTIDLDIGLSDVSAGACAVGIAPDDQSYNMAAGSYPNGWLFYLRNSGIMTIFKLTNPNTATAVGSSTAQATAALVANTLAHLRVAVTAAGFTLTRTDSGGFTPITVTDAAFRGGYVMVGKTGVAGSTKVANLAIT